MFDDIIDTAGTICEASKLLKKKGAKAVYVGATHAVFSGPAIERLKEAPIEECIVTNTIPWEEKDLPSNVKQLSVFLENKEGKLKSAVDAISSKGINIRALSIADSSKYGILRLIVSDNEKAIKALEERKFVVKETDVIVVGVKDEPNGLNSVLEVLEEANVNVEYLYAFVSTQVDEAIVVMKIENCKDVVPILREKNIKLLSKEDIDAI
jgi:hypothetical protein